MKHTIEHELDLIEGLMIENIKLDINDDGFEIDSLDLYTISNDNIRTINKPNGNLEHEAREAIQSYLENNDIYYTI